MLGVQQLEEMTVGPEVALVADFPTRPRVRVVGLLSEAHEELAGCLGVPCRIFVVHRVVVGSGATQDEAGQSSAAPM